MPNWPVISFHLVVFLPAVLGNCLICVGVCRNPALRTVTNCCIVNLTLAYLIVILVCFPVAVIENEINTSSWFGSAMCKIVFSVQRISSTGSVLTLMYMTAHEWFINYYYPQKYESAMYNVKFAIITIWSIALITELPEALYLTEVPIVDNMPIIYFSQATPTWQDFPGPSFRFFKSIFLYFLPVTIMSIAIVDIIRVLWKSPTERNIGRCLRCNRFTNMSQLNVNPPIENELLQSRKESIKFLVVLVVVFVLCNFPLHLMSLLGVMPVLNKKLYESLSLISYLLSFVNCALNPVICNFLSVKFHNEFRRTLKFCCCTEKRQQWTSNDNFNGDNVLNNLRQNITRSRSENDFEEIELPVFRANVFTPDIVLREGRVVDGIYINFPESTNE